jgi:hypothetical protein
MLSPGKIPESRLRYRAVLPTADLSAFPDSLRTIINNCHAHFLAEDRGHIRAANDQSHDSRATHFAQWLFSFDGVHPGFLQALSQNEALAIMGLYLRALLDGDNIKHRTDLGEDTLMGYVRAAAQYLETQYGIDVPIFLQSGQSRQRNHFHPYLADLIAQRRTWAKKRDKREALTGAMLDSMLELAVLPSSGGVLGEAAAVYDWARFGLYTGSRLGEYGQSKPKGRAPLDWHATIPHNTNVPQEWRGKPIAFLESDFEFFDLNWIQLSVDSVLQHPGSAEKIRVRFRYDKGKINFHFRTFKRIHGNHLCCVKAALSIIRRHRRLGRSPDLPMGVFRDAQGNICTIRGKHMERNIQQACVYTYQDPEHYLRRRIKLLQSHSIRIFACVALLNAGVSIDDIAYRLRWNSDAIKQYLRDCHRIIDYLTQQSILGAFHDERHPDTQPSDSTDHDPE